MVIRFIFYLSPKGISFSVKEKKPKRQKHIVHIKSEKKTIMTPISMICGRGGF